MDSNSCCSSLIKANCWVRIIIENMISIECSYKYEPFIHQHILSTQLILAKYRTSKLELIKRATEEAALDEFETRLFLRNHYANNGQNNLFLNFAQKVYNKAMLMITDYICSPDWSMFYDEGKHQKEWRGKSICVCIQRKICLCR